VIIISADHGENLGELNIYGDHQTADQITCRVPLIVKWPGVTDRVSGIGYRVSGEDKLKSAPSFPKPETRYPIPEPRYSIDIRRRPGPRVERGGRTRREGPVPVPKRGASSDLTS